jgi:hypothetical protein
MVLDANRRTLAKYWLALTIGSYIRQILGGNWG